MNVIIFGATGMIGEGALIECLEDPAIERVLAVGRRPTGREHPKLEELLHEDFSDFGAVQDRFREFDACLFCLGISSAGMEEDKYRRITLEFTEAASTALVAVNSEMTMCFISGAGTDIDSETMWKRIKGEAERSVLEAGFRRAYNFRPAGIFPRKGVVSGVRSYRIAYALLGWAYPLFKLVASNQVTTTDQLGRALIAVAKGGHAKVTLEGADINSVCA